MVVHVSSHVRDELHVVDGLWRVFVALLPHHSDFADAALLSLGDELEDDVVHLKLLHHVTLKPSKRHCHLVVVKLSLLLENLLLSILINTHTILILTETLESYIHRGKGKLWTACIVPGLDGAVGVPVSFVDLDTLDMMADGVREEVVFTPPLVVILRRPFKRNLCHVCS